MNVFNIVFQSVLALIGIGVLGFWILRRGILPENVIGLLSRLAIDIALPCMVFASIMVNFDPKKMPDWWQLPLWWVGFACISLVLTIVTMFVSQRSTRSEFGLSLFFQNALFFPLIIISGLFGSNSPYAAQLFIFVMIHPVIFFSLSHLFFKKKEVSDKQHKHKLNLRRILNPILIATILGVVARLIGFEIYLPTFIITMFTILGAMTLPLLMIILGGSLYIDFQKKGKIYVKEILKFIAIKNVVFPLVFVGMLIFIRVDYNIALIIFLQSAIPPITGTPIVTEREGGNPSIANQFILASFVFSIISIPLLFMLFSNYYPMP
jgi:malate permease and related proteins